jgi:hypothetical protein
MEDEQLALQLLLKRVLNLRLSTMACLLPPQQLRLAKVAHHPSNVRNCHKVGEHRRDEQINAVDREFANSRAFRPRSVGVN